ncbi:hypothetical protein [Algibacter mikhailovii]|uniref:hypothetical protein n=1 Tax=Algibacter mikhailovii TaxID=425498 RepID=UPI0024945927|nr:hypothetical protein [Algibacter mikhailovii]
MELKINYEEIIELINKKEAQAIKDFRDEKEAYYKNEDLTIEDLLKNCVNWKFEFISNKNSRYFILKEYLSKHGFDLRFGYNQEVKHEFYIFLNGLYQIDKTIEGNLLDEMAADSYNYKKSELNYFAVNELIEIINNNNNTQIKLPPVENFEIDLLNQLLSEYKRCEASTKEWELLCDKHKSYYDKIIQESNERYFEQIEKFNTVDSKLREVEWQLGDLKADLKFTNNYNEILKNEISRFDYLPVSQFDNLYWGNNYPALKALFNFLQKMKIVDFNWSHFANLMCVTNSQPFNLSIESTSKSDIGYLLHCIKGFFVKEFNSSNSVYHKWIEKKIYVDNQPATYGKYIKKYVRGYNKPKNELKHKSLIDDLCAKIENRYC